MKQRLSFSLQQRRFLCRNFAPDFLSRIKQEKEISRAEGKFYLTVLFSYPTQDLDMSIVRIFGFHFQKISL
jgi:hypothetical protein